jgi:hypothetical protein
VRIEVELHFRIVARQAFDHGRDFGRGTGFQLGVDAGRVLLSMPVNYDAFTAIAHAPLRHKVLIPGADFFSPKRGPSSPRPGYEAPMIELHLSCSYPQWIARVSSAT